MTDDLYCPRCAKPFTSETSYCRTCGLALDRVSKIVSGDAQNAPVTTYRPNFKLMRIGIGLFIFGVAVGLINGAVRDLGLFPDAYGKMVFLAIVAVGMLTMGAGFVFPTKKYAKRKPSPVPDEAGPDVGRDTASLAGQLNSAQAGVGIDFPTVKREPVMAGRPSVTEHTTRNLE